MSSGCLVGNNDQVEFGMCWFNTWRLSSLFDWRLGALVEAVLVHELLRQIDCTEERCRSSSTTPGTHNTLGSRTKSVLFYNQGRNSAPVPQVQWSMCGPQSGRSPMVVWPSGAQQVMFHGDQMQEAFVLCGLGSLKDSSIPDVSLGEQAWKD